MDFSNMSIADWIIRAAIFGVLACAVIGMFQNIVTAIRKKGETDTPSQPTHQQNQFGSNKVEKKLQEDAANRPAILPKKNPLNIPEKYKELAGNIKQWWHKEALLWWERTTPTNPACDIGNEDVKKDEAFLWNNQLLCESCANKMLSHNVDWDNAIKDLDKWLGPKSVPQNIKTLAEQLWQAPKGSPGAWFRMRIGSIQASTPWVMVAGTPETNRVPDRGDHVELVTADGIVKSRVSKFTVVGSRYICELENVTADKVKEGDILQAL